MAEGSESDEEKTEDPTPRRLEKAKEDGQVARSRELTTFMILASGVATLWMLGGHLYDSLGAAMEQSFIFSRGEVFDTAVLMSHIWSLGKNMLLSLLPLFLIVSVVALFAPVMLGGWLISAKSLQPQLSKLNPLKGLKRMFSSQVLAELGKAVAKSTLVGGVAVAFLWGHRGDFLGLRNLPLSEALARGMDLAALCLALSVSTLIVVVLIDVPFQLWSFTKKLRMSQDEIKKEHKETEGDPQIKARMRAQQQSMARRRMMAKVPDADVIVTNPTHYAVALQYEGSQMEAPRIVAKGADMVATRIRELGEAHGVPLLEAPPLARALHQHVDLDQEVPANLYTAVAEVLAWAYRLKRVREEGGEWPQTPQDLPVPDELDPSRQNVADAKDTP
ncbi:flagellar biosynthetic protein FlhB [Chromohalobacter marismortui]|uniref:Flagellar biosynthetic protein FlhB n=1 Tax=Chromohalobacter marismortui TaxID=42055 RepID=A0A4R7NPM0_9GAMM|nr:MULTISPECIES: flagellar biosynthesis protein FlhB [Chromohalobacter]MCI0508797.1 flagellar type III secretion system protein FlhB [Chromohalobacter sp.]MCI0592005.1 flagellar type III secretion system protein FlhB [Chromohalobacter sp.]TDU22833.1 flagellar biosynthetic protein FlhB [Chromohalobacter marismortui]